MERELAAGPVTNAVEADAMGERIAALLGDGQPVQAYEVLAPILVRRTPFRLLDRIGRAVGTAPGPRVDQFLDRIVADGAEGGWPVIGSALSQWSAWDLGSALARCREYVVAADVWYGADILGERVPGPALVAFFEQALDLMTPWRADDNRWVRRATGVAVHFWAKRSGPRGLGAPELAKQAEALLAFLEPLFEEKEMDAVKGIGWGLKTLGRQYPVQVGAWLEAQLVDRGRQPRALMLRKARTYLKP